MSSGAQPLLKWLEECDSLKDVLESRGTDLIRGITHILCCLHVVPLRIPNLVERHEAPCISVFGRSLMTQYHFDLDDSDDIRWVRDNLESRGSQDPRIRVLKFSAIGLYSSSMR